MGRVGRVIIKACPPTSSDRSRQLPTANSPSRLMKLSSSMPQPFARAHHGACNVIVPRARPEHAGAYTNGLNR